VQLSVAQDTVSSGRIVSEQLIKNDTEKSVVSQFLIRPILPVFLQTDYGNWRKRSQSSHSVGLGLNSRPPEIDPLDRDIHKYLTN
jgi:hypothetical protein